jgi:hypothetical protein
MERLRSVLSDSWPSRKALRRAAILGATAAAAFGVTSALASFGVNVVGGPGTYVSKRVFPGARTTSAYDFQDVSAGSTGTSVSQEKAFADALIVTTGNWASTFSTTRYVDFDVNAPLPGGTTPTSVNFNFRIIPNASGDTASYYFEVRRASTGAVLGTYGSSASPVASVTGSVYNTTSTAINDVTSSDIANDLRIRVYVKESSSKPIKIDMATVSGSSPYASFTLYPKAVTDASTGTPTTTTWELESADTATYTDLSNWPTTFSTSKYLRFTFPAYVPTGAVVSSATFNHSYKAATSGDNICYYVEVYNATTLIGTHGSSTTPYACNSTSSFVTDSISIPEVNTVTEADNVVIRVYVKDVTGSRKTIDDLDTLTLNYYYD